MEKNFSASYKEGITSKNDTGINEDAITFVGKNSRIPKKANHGKRPCSSVMRRLKKKVGYTRQKWGG